MPEPAPKVSSPTDKQARQWATICHISALAMFIGIPLGNVVGPLIVWLIKRNDHPLINEQGKEALNFQLSVTLYGLVSGVLALVLIGFVLLAILLVADLILTIVAAVKVSGGQDYRYPLTIRFIK